jgi:hypothetical protein
MRLQRWLVALCGLITLICAPAGVDGAGTFVLCGDTTPAFSLTNTEPDSAVPGNGVFFSNVLGAGQDVAVLNSSFNEGRAPTEINEFYSSRPGKTSMIINGPVTPSLLAGKELLVIAAPSADFTAPEVAAISSFYQAGGSIFALGESVAIDFGMTTNNTINGLIAGLGVPMSLEQRHFDTGLNFAEIAPHPLTNGVDSFRYGATTSVLGGTQLMFTQNHTPFVAVLPEPMALPLCAGVAASSALRSRRRGERGRRVGL